MTWPTHLSEIDRARSFVGWLLRHRVLVTVIAALVSLVAGYRTALTYSALRSDLEELLPETAPSVTALASLRERLPGLRNLGVVVDTGGAQNVPAASRFLDDLRDRIAAYPTGVVESVTVDVKAERRFLETYFLQLMDPTDIARIREIVEERRDEAVRDALDLDLEEDDADHAGKEPGNPLELPVRELRDKYEKRFGSTRSFPDDRFVSDDGKTAVLLIRASSHSTNHTSDGELLGRVRQSIAELDFPTAYAAELRVGFASDVATRIEEFEGLVADLSLSGLLVALLIVGVLVAYFRSLRSVAILGIPLAVGTFGAFAFVALPPLNVHYLNSNTAFLGSIIVGNGVNSGIILLARFREEHRAGTALEAAITSAVNATWRPTLAAALAASVAYGSLIFTDFRGFSQFGWIGGLGMVFCWLSTFVVGPPLMFWLGKPIRHENTPRGGIWAQLLVSNLLTRPRTVALVTLGLLLASFVGLTNRTDDWLEQDFSKLRRRDSWVSGERYWGARQDTTLQRYLTPTVVMASDADSARGIEAGVQQLKLDDQAGSLIATVRSLHTLLRPERMAAIEEARKLKEVLTPRLKARLLPSELELVDRALSEQSLIPLTPADLPAGLTVGLAEYGGRSDRNVLVFPTLGAGTWDAGRMLEFTDDLRRVANAYEPPPPIAGSLLLSSDITRAMKADGPRASAIALSLVLLITVVAFRSWKLSLIALGSLVAGVLVMLGVLAFTGQRVNFCNFVTLPITFGIAADYSINMLKRFQTSSGGELTEALTRTGGAVAMCSLTTIIGFGSLIIAQNQALFSFGVFAVTGELACLATAVLALPAALALAVRRSAQKPLLVDPAQPENRST